MKTRVFEKTLRVLLQQQPFKPFLIELDDGEQFVVGEPKAIMYQGGSQGMFFHVGGDMDFVCAEAVRKIVELVPASSK